MRAHRGIRTKWAIFVTMRGELIVQLDVAPALPNRRMVQGHIQGSSCYCKPRQEWHPQNIPLFVHERCFNRMEDAMPTDPKYDPNQKPDDTKKGDDAKKKKPDDEDEEEETDQRQEQETQR